MAALYIHIDDLGLGHTIRVWIWDAQKAHMGVMEHCYDDLTTSRRCVLGGGGNDDVPSARTALESCDGR